MEKSLEDQSQTLQLFYYYFPSCKDPLSEAEPKMGKRHEYFCKKLSSKALATLKTRYKHSYLMNSKATILWWELAKSPLPMLEEDLWTA